MQKSTYMGGMYSTVHISRLRPAHILFCGVIGDKMAKAMCS